MIGKRERERKRRRERGRGKRVREWERTGVICMDRLKWHLFHIKNSLRLYAIEARRKFQTTKREREDGMLFQEFFSSFPLTLVNCTCTLYFIALFCMILFLYDSFLYDSCMGLIITMRFTHKPRYDKLILNFNFNQVIVKHYMNMCVRMRMLIKIIINFLSLSSFSFISYFFYLYIFSFLPNLFFLFFTCRVRLPNPLRKLFPISSNLLPISFFFNRNEKVHFSWYVYLLNPFTRKFWGSHFFVWKMSKVQTYS